MAKQKINVLGVNISLDKVNNKDFISLTDIAKQSSENKPAYTIQNWMRNGNTLLFLEAWEKLHNPDFKVVQMGHFRNLAQENRYKLSPQNYINETNAIGITSTSGRYGGTYAHKDIALEFCGWLSPVFKVSMLKVLQDLLEAEYQRNNLEWHISKITDNIDEVRNLLDTIPHQTPDRNRLNSPENK